MSRISSLVCLVLVLALLGLVIHRSPGPKNQRQTPLKFKGPVTYTTLRVPHGARRLARRSKCCETLTMSETLVGTDVTCKDGVCTIPSLPPEYPAKGTAGKSEADSPAVPPAPAGTLTVQSAPPAPPGAQAPPVASEPSSPASTSSFVAAKDAPAAGSAPVAAAVESAAPPAPVQVAADKLAPPLPASSSVATVTPEAQGGEAAGGSPAAAENVTPPATEPAGPVALVWHTNYRKAMDEAVAQRKMMFIFFHDTNQTAARKAFETETLENPEIKQQLRQYVLARLPRDAQIKIKGQSTQVLKHPAFAEMLGRQGIAVIDLANPDSEYYGRVVSTFPFTPGKYYLSQSTKIILDLPAGTLTQRTMIYAVRIHPEAPASTTGKLTRVLADEAKQHSIHQASITLQGHHAWDQRFQRINGKLPSGLLAQEVVAESWPNQNLVDACVECVHSWRQSPGHWGAVRSRQPFFGYDIKRGRNGTWYATGIFGRR